MAVTWAATVAMAFLTATAPAPRYAVVVGANVAAPGRQPLRYAHRDAEDVAEVLVRTGQFPRAQVKVLLDPEPEAVLKSLDEALSAAAAAPDALLVFYYSGHADTEALYPAGRALSLAALRERLESPRAAVRLGVVDACRGGGWTQSKGLSREPPLTLSAPLTVTGEGSALLASSSGLESAHESDALAGSFFTHHLVAGLRGAADRDGDGEVTLGEAFDYAKALTVRDTSLQAEAPQHPSFQLNLRGRRDLPLARVEASSTVMDLRQQLGPMQVVQLSSGLVLLELAPGPRTARVAVPPGRYLVRVRGADGTRAREVAVDPGQPALVPEEGLELVPTPRLAAKDAEPVACLGFRRELALRPPQSHLARTIGVVASMAVTGCGVAMIASASERETVAVGPAGLVLLALGSSGLATIGLYALTHPDNRDLRPLVERCDAQLASHCPQLDEVACRGALEAACGQGSSGACWALDPSRPFTPTPPGADVEIDKGMDRIPCAPGDADCALRRALRRARPSP